MLKNLNTDALVAQSATDYNKIRANHEKEFAESAIHPDLIENFETYTCNKDILNALFVGKIERTNTGRVSAYYLDKYSGINAGWAVETLGSDYIQFKPDAEYRRIDSNGKEIKYENPPKHPSDIIRLKKLPEWITGNLSPEQYWEWVNSRDCKSGWITEGARRENATHT